MVETLDAMCTQPSRVMCVNSHCLRCPSLTLELPASVHDLNALSWYCAISTTCWPAAVNCRRCCGFTHALSTKQRSAGRWQSS